MITAPINLLLIDADLRTSDLLLQDIRRGGFGKVTKVADVSELSAALEKGSPDVIIFNYHSHRPDSVGFCASAKHMAPHAVLMAIASVGPAAKFLRNWDRQSGLMDALIEKPFPKERFSAILANLVDTQRITKATKTSIRLLTNLLPEDAVSVADKSDPGDVEMFEAAIVFTDIRRSSELITQMPAREFFKLLNQSLSMQAAHIREFEGSVIKYTGDGLMAIFRGIGRSHLALRCALAMADASSQKIFSYGTGVAAGLVLAGLVGDSNRSGQKRQYDIIGANVHLASRLCNLANAGEVIATKKIYSSARFNHPSLRSIGSVSVRGFAVAIECVAFNSTTDQSGTGA